MTKQQIEGIWTAILELIKISKMGKHSTLISHKALNYSFQDLGDEQIEIKAQLERDSTYLVMTCSQGSIHSGKMFTAEAMNDFLPIDNDDLKILCDDLFPKDFEDAIVLNCNKLKGTLPMEAVKANIEDIRARFLSAGRDSGTKSKPGFRK